MSQEFHPNEPGLTIERIAELTFWQKQILRRFQPQSILMSLVGMVWFTYFFWTHQWIPAVAVIFIERLFALTFVERPDYYKMAETTWGKIALLHLHPGNVVIQIAGLGLLFLGLWNHEVPIILLGISILLLGHWFGWSKVSECFAKPLNRAV